MSNDRPSATAGRPPTAAQYRAEIEQLGGRLVTATRVRNTVVVDVRTMVAAVGLSQLYADDLIVECATCATTGRTDRLTLLYRDIEEALAS